MATPGKISRGLHEKSETLIANEEVLFGQPVAYDTSNDALGVRHDVDENIAGVAMYDVSAGTDDSRNYEQNDPMEILKEGTPKVRVNQEWGCLKGTNSYYGYFAKGDPVYAVPESYFVDGRTYFAPNPTEFDGSGTDSADDLAQVTSSYFGPAVGKALESTGAGDDKAVIEVEFNLPDMEFGEL